MRAKMTCKICKASISELGAYVKVAVAWHEHLSCHDNMQMEFARNQGRNEILQEQADQTKFLRERAIDDAKIAYERARRCDKCGIAMMIDRPPTLPGVYPTALPASSDMRQCAPCVRAEVQARAGARGQQAPASAAEAIRTAPTRPTDILKPPDPKDQKKEDERKDRFELLEIE